MDINTNLNYMEELESKIELLNINEENLKFVDTIKDVMQYICHFDVETTETKILVRVFPVIENRFNRVFTDNYSLFETSDDEILAALIRENLEMVFQLTEIIQELLHYIYEQSPVEVSSIESVLKYLPKYVQLFTDHWRNSSDSYKTTFSEELLKISEVIKHLYSSFLTLLHSSLNVREDSQDISLLADALTVLCSMPKSLHEVDVGSLISTWKCFCGLAIKHSSLLENCLDIQIPIRCLTEDTCLIMEALFDEDKDIFRRQLKIITFLMKIVFKITHIFHKQLNDFAFELLIFNLRLLHYTPEYYIYRNLSSESICAINTDIFKNLEEFIRHLSVMDPSVFKAHLRDMSNKLKCLGLYEKYSSGYFSLMNKVLQLISDDVSDWSDVIVNLIEDIFNVLPFCNRHLFLDGYDGGIFQHLIINISASILIHDSKFQSTEILLKHILQDNIFVAVLALEIYTLIMSNVAPEECLLVLINILYGVDELICGFFTHWPEMIYLKCLLQRLFNVLPDVLKEQILKLFSPNQFIQIWRFLGFGNLPSNQIQIIIDPVIENTLGYINSISQPIAEDVPVNISEGLDLISTLNYSSITNDPRLSEVSSFLEKFWSSDIDSDILSNHVIKYFVSKISAITVICIQNSSLNPQLVFSRLKVLLSHQSYWIPTLKIVVSILKSIHTLKTSINNRNYILTELSTVIPLMLSKSPLLQELTLELLKDINESHRDTLNILLDNLDAKFASQIFEYMEQLRKINCISVSYEKLNKATHFVHICLKHQVVSNDNNILPTVKRFKFDDQIENENNPPIQQQPLKRVKQTTKMQQKEVLSRVSPNNFEEDSTAGEVIERLKGEVKCLMNVCKTEKLTQKNIAHLRIVMSQLSSLV